MRRQTFNFRLAQVPYQATQQGAQLKGSSIILWSAKLLRDDVPRSHDPICESSGPLGRGCGEWVKLWVVG